MTHPSVFLWPLKINLPFSEPSSGDDHLQTGDVMPLAPRRNPPAAILVKACIAIRMNTDFRNRLVRHRWPLIAAMLLLLAAAAVWLTFFRRLTVTEGKFPDELVYVRTNDNIVGDG